MSTYQKIACMDASGVDVEILRIAPDVARIQLGCFMFDRCGNVEFIDGTTPNEAAKELLEALKLMAPKFFSK